LIYALLYGLAASAAFPIGVLLGLVWKIPRAVLAAIVAFGAGTLVVALTFELMGEAVEQGSVLYALAGLFSGALLYIALDAWLDRLARKSPRLEGAEAMQVEAGAAAKPESARQASVSGTALLAGALIDGVPESAAIGMGLAASNGPGLGIVLLGAVFLSNLPEAIGSTAGMREAGRSTLYIVLAWTVVVIVCTASTVAGFSLLAGLPPRWHSFLLAFAAGGILAMLSDTMFPEAFKNGGPWVALATTAGFAVAMLLGELE
jgi:ZIP family zinc transporter